MPALTVRPATRDDIPDLVELTVELATYVREPEHVRLDAAGLEAALFGASPAVFAHVAEDADGRVVASAIWFLSFSTWEGRHGIYLEDLVVRPAARGTGAGLALLAALARICRDRGYARLDWEVLDWNENAIGFYRSIGARPVEGMTGYRLDGEALVALTERAARG